MIVVWWIKRDLRLSDNPALTAAVARAGELRSVLVPLWVEEPAMISAADTGQHHRRMLASALRGLRGELQRRGSDVIILSADLPRGFEALHRRWGIAEVHAEEEIGLQWSYDRDRAVRQWGRDRGVPVVEHPRDGVVRRLADRGSRMKLWKGRMAENVLAIPRVPALPAEFTREVEQAWRTYESAQDGESGALQRCDGTAARRTLNSFLSHRGREYRSGISSPYRSRHTGSRLSVHLAWGTLSLREVLRALEARRAELQRERDAAEGVARRELGGWIRSLSAFESRLHWHDHFIQRLEDEPEMEHRPLNRAFEDLHYDGEARFFQAWWEGRTGMPMVDAAMRSLHRTGFVNFRMRAMVVSAACHVLHLDWRTIRDPLARIMADYLPGIHVSQLQMQAGVVGINTVRVYNPAKQLIDNDPDCRFVHRFIPELRNFDCATVRAWTLATGGSASSIATERRRNGQMELFGDSQALGDYPRPLVDYRAASAEMKRQLYALKGSSYGRREAERVLSRHGSRRRRGR